MQKRLYIVQKLTQAIGKNLNKIVDLIYTKYIPYPNPKGANKGE